MDLNACGPCKGHPRANVTAGYCGFCTLYVSAEPVKHQDSLLESVWDNETFLLVTDRYIRQADKSPIFEIIVIDNNVRLAD